ncbi:MAG: hypothetical protein H0T89_29010 [Deltaproteobacteria bacterium]|nr:hypothetical protein [Deltaproteobacteria bacterium]MDQ3297302.1 hypothetical protein [Myxococcota bacterium]
MRPSLVLPFLASCALPPPPAPPQPTPTFALDDTYATRVSDLRTTLGRAGIALRTAGIDRVFASVDCAHPTELQAFGGCVRCELLGEHTPIDGAVLEATTRAFAVYPTEVLVASRLDHVAICSDIVYARAGVPQHPAGTVDLRGRGMLISVAYFANRQYSPGAGFTVDDIAHHELFHILEHEHMRAEMLDDPEWRVHNPVGFEYALAANDEPVRPGFVNAYAMTAAVEDRATVFEYLMAHPDELCALARTDELLRTKIAIIWRRVARIVGADVLRRRARCVDWVNREA